MIEFSGPGKVEEETVHRFPGRRVTLKVGTRPVNFRGARMHVGYLCSIEAIQEEGTNITRLSRTESHVQPPVEMPEDALGKARMIASHYVAEHCTMAGHTGVNVAST